jgi:hypothetical protein
MKMKKMKMKKMRKRRTRGGKEDEEEKEGFCSCHSILPSDQTGIWNEDEYSFEMARPFQILPDRVLLEAV